MKTLHSTTRLRLGLTACLLSFSAPGHAETEATTTVGENTVVGYKLSPDFRAILSKDSSLLMRLPATVPSANRTLLGMLRHGAEYELFLGSEGPMTPSGPRQQLELFRGRRGGEARLDHAYTLETGGFVRVVFFQPPDNRDTPKVTIDVLTGSWEYTTYLLAPDRQSVKKLFATTNYDFRDLDHDGVYELVVSDRRFRHERARCGFSLVPQPPLLSVMVHAGDGYRQVFPPADWADSPDGASGAPHLIDGSMADLRGVGSDEFVILQDRAGDKPTQSLAVYRFEHNSMQLVAQTPLAPQRIAYQLVEIRDSAQGKQIVVRTGPPGPCGKEPSDEDTAYVLRGDKLEQVR